MAQTVEQFCFLDANMQKYNYRPTRREERIYSCLSEPSAADPPESLLPTNCVVTAANREI